MSVFEKLQQQLIKHQYTWLITGVAGFIGANLLETLLKLNQKVIGLDNFSTGFRGNLTNVLAPLPAKLQNNFVFYEGDICNLSDCQKAVNKVDYVLHQAALGSVPRSIITPEITNATNVSGFLNILIAAKEAKVKRFIYASSSSVYGDSPILPKKESQIGHPLSPYAVSKYTNELYATAFSHCYEIETIGLRYFNVFGPRQNKKGPYAAVIPLWITAFLNDMPIYIYGDGLTSRDFCYIDNVVEANLLAATTINLSAINQVYNITVGAQTTLNELFEFISRTLKIEKKPIYKEERKGDIRHSLADISRAKKLLGYTAKVPIEQGLKTTIDWFKICQ